MLAVALNSSARRGVSCIYRQLMKGEHVLKCSSVTATDSRRQLSQYPSPWFQALFESPPVLLAEQALMQFYEFSGLPWWCCIAVSTIGLRSLTTFPLAVYSEITLARLANLEPEAAKMNEALKAEVLQAKRVLNLTKEHAERMYKINLKKQTKLLVERENCHPMKARLLLLIQIPLWISLSCALRTMCMKASLEDYEYLALLTEGFLWVKNLTLPDPFLILPIATALFNLTNVELYHLKSTLPQSRWLKIIHNVFRVSSVIVIPLGLLLPSGISLFWLCSAFAATVQHVILMSPRFRRAARIPITARENPEPYLTVWSNFQKNILRKKTMSI